MLIYLSFPTEVSCSDRFCPVNGYGEHTHTLYNAYGVAERAYREGMTEIDASEIASVIRPNEIAPVNSKKGTLQNV